MTPPKKTPTSVGTHKAAGMKVPKGGGMRVDKEIYYPEDPPAPEGHIGWRPVCAECQITWDPEWTKKAGVALAREHNRKVKHEGTTKKED